MAKSNSRPSANEAMVGQLRDALEANPVIGPQIGHFWEAQDNILSDSENFARHWFERRHTATRTALNAAREMSECGLSDPAGAIKVMARWQTHSMERVAQDFQEWLGLCSRCAGYLSRAEVEAGEEGMKSVAKTMSSTRRPKDDVPV